MINLDMDIPFLEFITLLDHHTALKIGRHRIFKVSLIYSGVYGTWTIFTAGPSF